jgi:cytochrome c peroxidase
MHARTLISSTLLILVAGTVLGAAPLLVHQKGLVFTPNELAVKKGQDVTFVNDDSTAHNIMISGGGVSFNGGLQPPGGSIKYTFSKPGTYLVGCGIHPKMKLTITVD